jgi:hypothetical protein
MCEDQGEKSKSFGFVLSELDNLIDCRVAASDPSNACR